MANCDRLFKRMNSNLLLSKENKSELIRIREILRQKIRSFFMEKGLTVKFQTQGSYALNTIIKPYSDSHFDIDDGVYLLYNNDLPYKAATYKKWLHDAVAGHTNSDSNKNKCVRVQYSKGYHVDFTFYHRKHEKTPFLATNNSDWIESDPLMFNKWVREQSNNDSQVFRIIRYLKCWKEHRKVNISGFILTILVVRNISRDERDDIAFKQTMERICQSLRLNYSCTRPTPPVGEELLDPSKRQIILAAFNDLLTFASEAIDENNHLKSSRKWQRCFGSDLFEDGIDEDEVNSIANELKSGRLQSSRIGLLTLNGKDMKVPDNKGFYGR